MDIVGSGAREFGAMAREWGSPRLLVGKWGIGELGVFEG